jgi:hypothetical protein
VVSSFYVVILLGFKDTLNWFAQRRLLRHIKGLQVSEKPDLLEQFFTGFWLLLLAFFAAVMNASLILFAHSFYTPSLLQYNSRPLLLATFTASICCRYVDFITCKRTNRGRHLLCGHYSSLSTAFYCQCVLFITRAVLRYYLGLHPFMAIQMPGPEEAEGNFALERYLWIDEIPLSMQRVVMVGALLGPPLHVLGRYLMGTAEDRTTEKKP